MLATSLLPGQASIADEAHFGTGENRYFSENAAAIVITDLPIRASLRHLAQIGIFGTRQDYVINVGEGQLLWQGVRITWTRPELRIGTIPANSIVQGPIVVTRR